MIIAQSCGLRSIEIRVGISPPSLQQWIVEILVILRPIQCYLNQCNRPGWHRRLKSESLLTMYETHFKYTSAVPIRHSVSGDSINGSLSDGTSHDSPSSKSSYISCITYFLFMNFCLVQNHSYPLSSCFTFTNTLKEISILILLKINCKLLAKEVGGWSK